ncbi:co-chaperone DjlA [Rhabdochromatium marinum]|uniref:co-chaperone DjlA n=1 Tax=Rhabdochromatium marinum TaxID=48729 RepID=UPI00190505F6|nr:co-chaperone DjlA [Rhabdochromatium marinum]MBK1648255.1 molecular chaperone DjlA [Rhabdochromatium marinum]
MGWVGKVVGSIAGLVVADAPGALIGAALGHGVDYGLLWLEHGALLSRREREQVQAAFRTATFSTMGHVAKADGRVSEAEIAMAEAAMTRMRFSPEKRRQAIADFKRGKAADFVLADALATFWRACRGNASLLEMFLRFQLQAAYADGLPSAAQRQLLHQVRRALRIPEPEFRQLEQLTRAERAGASSRNTGRGRKKSRSQSQPDSASLTLAQAYRLLGVKPSDTDAVIKRAYRQLRSKHHPDKLIARGLPEEMLKLATEKTQQIRQAYELIRRERAT